MVASSHGFPDVLANAVCGSVPIAFPFLTDVSESDAEACPEKPTDGIVSIISFHGDYSWAFTLVLPRATAEGFCLAFTGFDFDYSSPEMGDLVGELANVIAGEISAQLFAKGMEAKMSLPTVARGHELELIPANGMPTTKIRFQSAQGPFAFDLTLAKQASSWANRRPSLAGS